MKITDPALSPDNFGPLLFESLHDDPRGRDIFALMVNGTAIGELAPLDPDHDDTIVIDELRDCVMPPERCWTLELAEPDGRLKAAHTLCIATHPSAPTRSLTGELAVWATLTTIWETTHRARHQG